MDKFNNKVNQMRLDIDEISKEIQELRKVIIYYI